MPIASTLVSGSAGTTTRLFWGESMNFLAGTYDSRLMALSVIIALLASYTALDLIGRIRAAEGRVAYGWLLGGAISMGTGVWSMHFVGMLALELPIKMGYRVDLTTVSWLLAVLGSLIALHLASGRTLSRARPLCGTASMAGAIVSMHYLGMAAMDMTPAIVYDPYWVAASIAIALAASAAALHVGFNLPPSGGFSEFGRKAAAASLLGCAISGMHYAGMKAADFPLGGICGAASEIDSRWLALLISNSTILLLGTMLIAVALDRRLDNRTAQLVHALQAANVQLHYASRRDTLTNLGNRQLLRERLDLGIANAEATATELALLYVDLDDFKAFNDNLGHDFGDTLLMRVASAMSQSVRTSDTVSRIGGDEFVLLITTDVNTTALHRTCERLLAAIRSVECGQARLSASIGIARYPTDGATAPALLRSTDLAMYSAKRAGKNRYAFFIPALTEGLEQDFAIQNELGDAIQNAQIVPHYQPKYDVRTRQLVGAEALARWFHPADGPVPPDRFIAIAERSNQINELQMCMLRGICADIRDWRERGFHVPPVAFNLSALSLRNTELPGTIIQTLEEFGLSSGDLICEITETAALPELDQTLRTLRKLREVGIRIAIDDFGTGLSSMSYLRDLPIDQLKIDRTFIARLETEAFHETTIVRSMIDLAHSLKLSVVAEGVELDSQLACLARLKCDQVQGYLFSPALPATEYMQHLQKHSPHAKVVALY